MITGPSPEQVRQFVQEGPAYSAKAQSPGTSQRPSQPPPPKTPERAVDRPNPPNQTAQKIFTSDGGMARTTVYNGRDDQWGNQTAYPNPLTGESVAVEGLTVAGPKDMVGQWIQFEGEDHPRYVHDVGSAVEARTASRGKLPVLDIYTAAQDIMEAARSFGDQRAFKVVPAPDPDALIQLRKRFGLDKT